MSNNKPIHRLRIGNIGAAIFENKTQDGKTFYNAQFDRSYREGETWKHTQSYGRDDMLILAKLADQVHSWIVEKQQVPATDEGEQEVAA